MRKSDYPANPLLIKRPRKTKRSQPRPYRNLTEACFIHFAATHRFRVTKRGWPDFLCWGRDGFFVVEVKPRRRDGNLHPLKQEQVVCLEWLVSLGAACFVFDGVKLIPYTENGLDHEAADLILSRHSNTQPSESAKPNATLVKSLSTPNDLSDNARKNLPKMANRNK